MRRATSCSATTNTLTWRRASDFPRRRRTTDPIDRDVQTYPHGNGEEGFAGRRDLLGRDEPGTQEVLRHSQGDDGRRRSGPCSARALGRHASCGNRSSVGRPSRRLSGLPASASNPSRCRGWDLCRLTVLTNGRAGTLFPLSSKKVARAINAASNNRPVVVLANLSGFDGSPESMRSLQLEYGAEIGRAVVNFKGPIVFCVISRYHGGAYVVFSRALNEGLEVAALEGTFASVIGGAPAAAVVFAGEVEARTRKDPRLHGIEPGHRPGRRQRKRASARAVE